MGVGVPAERIVKTVKAKNATKKISKHASASPKKLD
jgi:hypothetical protein